MTQEQKDKMEQEVRAYTIPYIRNHGQRMGDIVKQDFTSIYQNILDNYHDYGLQSMEKYKDMVSSNVRLGAENQRLREALERIIHDKDVITANDMIAVAEEALKQQDND